MSLRGDRAIHVEQLIIGKISDVIMIVTWRIDKDRAIWIVRIGRTSYYEIAIARMLANHGDEYMRSWSAARLQPLAAARAELDEAGKQIDQNVTGVRGDRRGS